MLLGETKMNCDACWDRTWDHKRRMHYIQFVANWAWWWWAVGTAAPNDRAYISLWHESYHLLITPSSLLHTLSVLPLLSPAWSA